MTKMTYSKMSLNYDTQQNKIQLKTLDRIMLRRKTLARVSFGRIRLRRAILIKMTHQNDTAQHSSRITFRRKMFDRASFFRIRPYIATLSRMTLKSNTQQNDRYRKRYNL